MRQYMLSIFFIIVWLRNPFSVLAQDPTAIRSKCQSELSDINAKINAHNAEYEKIKEDLREGLFCSKCGQSKTELDKTEGFYVHLRNVKGSPVAATPQQMNDAYKRYLDKYNSLKSTYDAKSKSCDENYNNAVSQQNENAERARQADVDKQLERQKQAQENAERAKQAEQERLQQLQLELQKQQEAERQQILEQAEKNKQDAVKMFTDDANRMKDGIHSIEMPSEKISFDNRLNTDASTGRERPVSANVEDFNFDGTEFETNNYFDQYSDQVRDITMDQIAGESGFQEIVKNGYEAFAKLKTYMTATRELMDGKLTPETVSVYFSQTSNAVIGKIQTSSGNVAVADANTTNELANRIFGDDFSERDVNNAMNAMNPFHFSSTYIKSDKPLSIKDGAMIVGGGIVLSAIGAPIWLGIGAAAWYGFNR